ncbi:MAG TPA: protoporphyrinogen oxidase, partial [Blastocatellia bacterium]|nr:protoporphyrinogen oxidase [Blastocatellia bacterium]
VAGRLLGEIAPEIAQLVAEIPYVSIASVPLAYRAEQVSRELDGFGFLAPRLEGPRGEGPRGEGPRHEGLRILGSVWNSSLFAWRAPEGWVCLTNFIGGATDTEAIKLGDEELIRIVHNDLRKVLGVSGEPRRLPITRYERAIPQYVMGHAARVERIESLLREIPGVWIAGHYLRGIALGDCIKQAERVAVEIDRAIR